MFNNSMNTPIKTKYTNKTDKKWGIFLFSREFTNGFKALIIIKPINNEKIKSLNIQIKLIKIIKKTVKTIVLAEISIFCMALL